MVRMIGHEGLYIHFCEGCLAGVEFDKRTLLQEGRRGYRSPSDRLSIIASIGYSPSEASSNPYDWYWEPCSWQFDDEHIMRTKAPAGSSLDEALARTTCDLIKRALRFVGAQLPENKAKASLIAAAANDLPNSMGKLDELLRTADKDAFDLLLKTMQGGQIPLSVCRYAALAGAFPYVFEGKTQKDTVAFMPSELREAAALLDLDSIIAERRFRNLLDKTLRDAAILCGIADFNEILALSLLEAPEFTGDADKVDDMLAKLCEQSDCYKIHAIDGVRYVESVRIQSYPVNSSCGEPNGRRAYRPCVAEVINKMHADSSSPITAGVMANLSVEDRLYAHPASRALTAYFDAHVPYQESALTFADETIDTLIDMALFRGTTLNDAVTWLTNKGWYLAEGGSTAPRLTKLIADFWSNIPRWELNGWSEREWLDLQSIPTLISASTLDEETPLAS